MNKELQLLLSILVCAAVTIFTRALPFLLFGRKNTEAPAIISYLANYLPPAIMVILVLYCIRNTAFTVYPYGLREALAIVIVICCQYFRKNTILSVILGTFAYIGLGFLF